jgi:RHS repeat-associated protein
MDAVRLADILGNGIGGVLWTSDATSLSRAHMFFLDFTGGTKPYLMNEMNNHTGSVTRVKYQPSTRFYLCDEERLDTRWKTPLPFPVQVVARIEVIDQISGGKLTTEYSYHHGYWDGAEREFRGFGRTDQRDTEVFDDFHASGLHDPDRSFEPVAPRYFSPPTETRTWFHQGPVGDEFGEWEETDFSAEFWPGDPQILSRPPLMTNFLESLPRRVKRDALRTLQGRILRTELYALDRTARQDRPYTVSEYQFGVCEVVTRDGRQELSCEPRLEDSRDRLGDEWPARVFFPHALGQRTTQWERGDDPVTQFSFTEDYNENGQPRRQTQIACPRGWQRLDQIPAQAYLATSARTVYAVPLDPDVYILDRVSRITTYEILNDGTQRALDLKDLPDDSPSLKIIGQNLNYYDGDAFSGRPFGKVGNYGALVRSESLVLTEEILSEAYKSGDAISNPPELPPYLVSGVPIVWTDEYPQDYRNSTQVLAGYLYKDGAVGSPYAPGYFAVVARHQYDFQLDPAGVGRGLRKVTRDPLGRDTAIRYDPYDLLPIEITDPAGLRTKVTYDYRVLQPQEATEPNENRSRYTFTPLGLVRTIAVMGKAGENVGDTDATPGALFEYDFAFSMDPDPKPISVKTTRRVHHTNDRDVSLAQRDQTIVSIEYSDGFGRLHQTRTQAEDVIFDDPALVAPVFGQAGLLSDQTIPVREAVGKGAEPGKQWAVVSGWQFYDNKGRVVEKYEPFFSIDWNYAPPSDSEFGQKDTLYYDPRGRVIRTVKADGSEQRIIYGVPADLSDPDDFSPTPWETYTYDANDNSGRTHPADSQSYQHHWNTPTSASKDALGRTVLTTDRNRRRLPAGGWSPVEEYYTRSAYDIRGNLLTVIDTLGRKAFNHIYDLSNNPLRFQNIDAGVKRTVLDASGNIVERRDSKGAVILNAYDLLNRPVQLWARDNSNERVTLRERLEYGDGGDPNQPANERTASRSANLLGKLSRHYDEAGLLSIESNDFKGNILEKSRQVIRDEEILKVFNPAPTGWRVPAFRVDWTPPAGITLQNHANNLLEAGTYQTSITYDALNRIKMMRYPQDEDGARKTLSPHYNRAGALERVELNGVMYVERIAYNAKGQRTLIVYGNGLMTRYSYDVGIFRLVRMRTEPYSSRDPQAYYPAGPPLQDLAYGYDLTGNILSIVDRTPGCGVLNNPDALQAVEPTMARLLASGNSLIRRFEYDPLYRLQSATGRECSDISRPRAWPDDPRCGFNGNNAGTPNQGNAPNLTAIYREDYAYDAAGNMVSMRHSNNRNSWTRLFGMGGLTPQLWNREWPNHLGPAIAWANASGNILTHVGDDQPGPPQTHFFDDNGNLVRETSSRHFEWDHSDRMRVYRTQARSALALLGMDRWAEPSVHTHYLYDTAGQRVKKLVRTQGGDYEVTVYIDGIFEHYRWNNNDVPKENDRLYILDDKSCIAIVRIGERHADDNGPVVQYHLGDHLGTSTVVINDIGDWINREEYLPYGETSFGSFAKKRYRYTGKERDEESGLYYHGARYLAPWLARWISPDPVGISDGLNVYAYVRDNPLSLVDRSGRSSGAPDKDLPNWLRQLREAEGEIKRQEEALRSGKASQEAGDVAWQDAEQVGDQIAREYIDRGERLTESMRRLEAHQEERERLSPKELNATRRSVEDVTREIRDRSSRQVVDDIRSAEKQLEHERQLRDFERRLGEPPPEEGGGGGGGGKWGGRGGGGGVGGRGGGFGSTPLGGALFGIIVTIIYEGLKDFVLAGSGLDLERREAKADVFYFSPEQERELSLIRAEREVERLIERRALEQGISVDEQRKRMDAALKSLPPYPVLTAGRN